MTITARLYSRGKWKKDEDGSESCVDVWELVASSETETLTNLLAVSGLPHQGDAHEEKTTATCRTLEMDHHDSVLNVWYYNANYSTKTETRENTAWDVQRVKGGMKSGFIEVPAFFDARGFPLINTAGDLYENLKRKVRTRVVNVTANFQEIPDWLFNLADTVNSASVTIHGRTYPAGTCRLTDVDMPDEPSTDPDGNLYWPVTYKIEINPLGYSIQLPNTGLNELIYQTRESSTSEWEDDTVANYDSKSPPTDRRVIKRRIMTSEQQDSAGPIWLDANGQATRVVSFGTSQIGTGTISADSTTLTLSTGAFDTTAHKGSIVRVQGAGAMNGWLTTKITSLSSTTVATLQRPAFTTISPAKQVWVSGAIINEFILDDLADWSSVPLPNNHPTA